MKLTFEVTGAPEAATMLDGVGERFEGPLTDALQSIAILWETDFRRNFERQGSVLGAWEPLAPMTQSLRKWRGFNPASPILVRTSDLLQSIGQLELTDESVTVGTNLRYAAVLQFGGVETWSKDVPGEREVPARPFVVLSPDLIEESMATLSDFLFGEGARAN